MAAEKLSVDRCQEDLREGDRVALTGTVKAVREGFQHPDYMVVVLDAGDPHFVEEVRLRAYVPDSGVDPPPYRAKVSLGVVRIAAEEEGGGTGTPIVPGPTQPEVEAALADPAVAELPEGALREFVGDMAARLEARHA